MKSRIRYIVPGTRVLKTLIAIVVAVLAAKILGLDASTMSVIALFSISTSFEDTKRTAIGRFKGTAFAGVYTYFVILILLKGWEIDPNSFLYYILILIALVILIQVLIRFGQKESFVYAVMIYLSISLGPERFKPFQASVMNIFQAVIGIIVCLKVESSPAINNLGKSLEEIKKNKAASKEPFEATEEDSKKLH